MCFVDMVGFTRLGAQIDPQELGSLASRLAELATDVTEPPVRLVKTIGDAAMFVSPEAGTARVGGAVAARGGRGGRAAEPARRGGLRPRATARRRLLRPRGQPGQPGDRRGPPRRACCAPRRCATPPPTTSTGRSPASTSSRACRTRSRCTAPAGSSAVTNPRMRSPPRRASSLRRGRQQSTTNTSGELGGIVGGRPPFSVGQAGRDDQLPATADLHARDALDPALRSRRRRSAGTWPAGRASTRSRTPCRSCRARRRS